MSSKSVVRRRQRLLYLLPLVLASFASCRRELRPDPHFEVASSREVLRGRDIGSFYANTLDAIEHLRPEFLTAHASLVGTSTPVEPVVYLDGNRLVALESLRGVPVNWVREIRYVRGSVAAVRYGGDHAAGALLVSTLRRKVARE